MSKNTFKREAGFLLLREEGKRHYMLTKDFNIYIYDHTLLPGRKHFCCCFVPAFSTAEISKSEVNPCFKLNGKQMIKTVKNVNMFDLKIKKGK